MQPNRNRIAHSDADLLRAGWRTTPRALETEARRALHGRGLECRLCRKLAAVSLRVADWAETRAQMIEARQVQNASIRS